MEIAMKQPDDRARFRALPEAEGRVLLLISAFSGTDRHPAMLEGRLKLAKLDFLVRYPRYLGRALQERKAPVEAIRRVEADTNPLQDRMIRYRYGPWDPSYFAVLGSLIGRGLVEAAPYQHGVAYRATAQGRSLVAKLVEDDSWGEIRHRTLLVKRHLDLSGTTLKELVYRAVPEMTNANWQADLA
jgi:hypothetical protein